MPTAPKWNLNPGHQAEGIPDLTLKTGNKRRPGEPVHTFAEVAVESCVQRQLVQRIPRIAPLADAGVSGAAPVIVGTGVSKGQPFVPCPEIHVRPRIFAAAVHVGLAVGLGIESETRSVPFIGQSGLRRGEGQEGQRQERHPYVPEHFHHLSPVMPIGLSHAAFG